MPPTPPLPEPPWTAGAAASRTHPVATTGTDRTTRHREYQDEHLEWWLKPQRLISSTTKLKIRAGMIGFLICAALYENSMAATGQRPIYRKAN